MELRHLLPISLLTVALSCASTTSDQAPTGGPTRLDQRVESFVADGQFSGELWRLNLSQLAKEKTHDRVLQVEGDLLYVQDQTHLVHAIDLETGIHEWVVSLSGEMSQPVQAAGELVTFVFDDRMVSVRTDSGARVIGQPELRLDFWPWSAAVSTDQSLYVGRAAPYGVQAVDSQRGVSGWQYHTKGAVSHVMMAGSGGIADVVAATEDGFLVSLPTWPAIGKAPTEENWQRRLPAARITSLSGSDGRLFVGSDDTFLYCMDEGSGRILWKNGAAGRVTGPARSVDGAVYVPGENALTVFDAETGQELWNCTESKRFVTQVGELCYLATDNQQVSVRQVSDGAEVARLDARGLHLPTVPQGGILVIGDGRGHVYALR